MVPAEASPASLAEAVNTLASFLAHETVRNPSEELELRRWITIERQHPSPGFYQPVDVVVLCASAVLCAAETVLSAFAEYVQSTAGRRQSAHDSIPNNHHVVLVLCGGIGHSTQLMYEAVASHPRFKSLADHVSGQPEARILLAIAEQYYGLKLTSDAAFGSTAVSILVEDQSTNCGANASKTRDVLESHGITSPQSIVVSQDPTMCRRTVASFEKVYSDQLDHCPHVYSWPTFVPAVRAIEHMAETNLADVLAYDFKQMGMSQCELWGMPRFLDLTLGEIPRLRDDADGYGPKGKGFIVHVKIPVDVKTSWRLLDQSMTRHRIR